MLIETRGNDNLRQKEVGLYDAILNPTASFNGLWTLKNIPQIKLKEITHLSYNDLSKYIFNILGAPSDLLDVALETYKQFDNASTPVEFSKIENNLFIQKLYIGPTRAFKDMAMQPFGSILCNLAKNQNKKYLILTATSGDTGPATLEAVKNKPNIYTLCMYPNKGTSDVQRLQMTTIDAKNTKVLALNGDFDDAQSALKDLLNNDGFKDFLISHNFLLSATNSVNFGRIIFQIIYHIYSYVYLLKNNIIKDDEFINIIVPSGNFGNSLGAFYAKKMGVKINKIIVATNANSVLFDFIKYGKYDISNRKLLKTNSPAMDILKSSNIERVLFHLYGANRTKELMENLESKKSYSLTSSELLELNKYFDANKSNDDEVLEIIKKYASKNIIIDPHTATAVLAYRDSGIKTIVCSTAEWSKFAPTIIKAIKGDSAKECLKDKEALDFISKTFNLTIHKNIKDLFNKAEVNKTIVNKDEVYLNIKDWLSQI